jgi:hypothetical protein
MKQYTFWFECTDNGGGHQGFTVKAENKQYKYTSFFK